MHCIISQSKFVHNTVAPITQALYCHNVEPLFSVTYAKHGWQYRACVIGATVLCTNLL